MNQFSDLNINLKVLLLKYCDTQTIFSLIRINKEFHNINCNKISLEFGTVTESLYQSKCEKEFESVGFGKIISFIEDSSKEKLSWKDLYKLIFKYNKIVHRKDMNVPLTNRLIDEGRLFELKLLYHLNIQRLLIEHNAAMILINYKRILNSIEPGF